MVFNVGWSKTSRKHPLEISREISRQPYFKVPNILAVGVGSLLSAEGGDDVDEATIVLNTTSGTARLLLLLLLLLHFGRLSLDFTGTSQRTVDFASEKTARHLDGGQLAQATGSERLLLDERRSIQVEDLVLDLINALQLADMISQRLDRFESRDIHRVDAQVSAHEKLHLG